MLSRTIDAEANAVLTPDAIDNIQFLYVGLFAAKLPLPQNRLYIVREAARQEIFFAQDDLDAQWTGEEKLDELFPADAGWYDRQFSITPIQIRTVVKAYGELVKGGLYAN